MNKKSMKEKVLLNRQTDIYREKKNTNMNRKKKVLTLLSTKTLKLIEKIFLDQVSFQNGN